MKKLTLILLLTASLAAAQSPNAFKFQAVVRGADGTTLDERSISMRISILDGSATGTAVYSENHTTVTSSTGVVNLQIGTGTALVGDFNGIAWGEGEYYIKLEIDPLGGNAFTTIGTSQLVSVPYSLYSNRSAHADGPWVTNPIDQQLSYTQGKVSIGTTTQVSPSSLYIDTPLPVSFETRSNGIFLQANDMVSRGYPLWIRSNTTSMSYGTSTGQTMGRMLRMQDQRFGFDATWDFGIDANKSLFLLGGNNNFTQKFTVTTDGQVGINNPTPQYQLDVNGTLNADAIFLDGMPLTSDDPTWVKDGNNDLSYMGGKVTIGANTQVSRSALYVNAPLPTSFETRNNGIFLDATDMISLGYPLWVRSNTTGLSYGTGLGQTLGRMLRMQDLRFGFDAIWDFGIDANKSLFLLGGNNDFTQKFTVTTTGNVGIGASEPASRLQVQDGDVYLSTLGTGVIMKSPDGSCWRMTVNNGGAPVFTAITCPN